MTERVEVDRSSAAGGLSIGGHEPTGHSGTNCPERGWLVPLTVVLALALLVRVGVLMAMPGALVADPDGYRRLAENLVEHQTFGTGDVPTAYRPPLYPLLLAACATLAGLGRGSIGVLHVGMGLATVGLVFLAGWRWGLNRWMGVLAGGLTACDPILLAQSAQVMTETLATLLAVGSLVALGWATSTDGHAPGAAAKGRRLGPFGRTLVAGCLLGLCALCRPESLVWAGASVIAMAILASRRSMRWRSVAGLLLGIVVVVSPWAARNQWRFGRPIVTTTHGGYTLLLANNPPFYDFLRSGERDSVWDAEGLRAFRAENARSDHARADDRDNELLTDRRNYALARETIRRQPGMFLFASLVRVGRLWNPLPHQVVADEGPGRRIARYAVGLCYLIELPLAAACVWMVVRGGVFRRWLWALLLVASLTAVHTVYWTDMRMRAPLMPVVALAVAHFVAFVGRRANRAPCPKFAA